LNRNTPRASKEDGLMLKNLKISTKLTGGFGIVLTLLLVVMGIYFFALTNSLDRFGSLLHSEVAIHEAAMNLNRYMLECRRQEKNFLIRHDTQYLKKFDESFNRLKKQIEVITSLVEKTGQAGIRQLAGEIAPLGDKYGDSFRQLAAALEKRGLDHQTGLQGAFRNIAHQLETDAKEHAVDDLQIAFLQLRRYEKDFHRTQNDSYRKKWADALSTYQTLLTKSNCEKESLTTQRSDLNEYQKIREKYLGLVDSKAADSEIDASYEQLRSDAAEKIGKAIASIYIPEVKALVLEIRKHEKDYLLRLDKTYVEKLKQAINNLTSSFRNAGVLEKHIQTMTENTDKYQKAFDLLVAEDERIKILNQNMMDSARAVEPLVEKIDETSDKLQNEKETDTIQNASLLNRMALLMGGLAILTGFLLSALITISIKKPLAKTLQFAKGVRAGDLSMRLRLQSRDEIGELSQTLDEMVDNLNTKQDQLQQNLSNMEGLVKEVAVISDQVHSGAQQVSDSSMALSQGASEQASSLEQITSSMTEIGSQTRTNAENAAQANQISLTAKEKTMNGMGQMNEMVQAMANINDSSKAIGKIIKAIDSIAFQTNLLALNAAVEAARAGQHGKGFAVVAQEVRSLAVRSAQAAQETTILIETAGKNVDKGSAIVETTAKALDEINDNVTKVSDLVAEIAAASNEQAQGISQVNQGLGHIDSVTQQNTATSEETAAAAEELTGQAAVLRQLLGRFGNGQQQSDDPIRIENKPAPRRIDHQTKQLPSSPPPKTPDKESTWGKSTNEMKHNPAVEPAQVIRLDDSEFGKY
jgi:methyl-accepting chemotaxis protein